MSKSWSKLWQKIHYNSELIEHELDGFRRGHEKGKTMNVPLKAIIDTIKKQETDLENTVNEYVMSSFKNELDKNKLVVFNLKRTLADLRNACGAAFLKLQELHGSGEW